MEKGVNQTHRLKNISGITQIKKTKIVLSYSDNYDGVGRLHGNSWALFQHINITNKPE
ncbi:MAG: hypothetical protein ACQPRH_03765 [Solitalea-like symbiont of Tyrophagus putrescentiae]